MKRIILFLLLTVIAVSLSFNVACSQDWQEVKGDHFIVFFTGEPKFAQDVLGKAEIYYRRIADNLGYARYKEFWLWDKRCKIYIYPDHQSYLKASGATDWSQGMAEYKNRTILSYAWSEGFLDSLLPHEIAHLIFRDFIGLSGQVPLWLDEGVAQWSEENKRPQMRKLVKQLYQNDGLLLLSDMMKLDIQNLKDKDLLFIRPALTQSGNAGVVFLSTTNLVNTYYIEAVSLVGFLIEKYGSMAFANFCRELRDGKDVEGALKSVYLESLSDLNGLQEKWKQYLMQN